MVYDESDVGNPREVRAYQMASTRSGLLVWEATIANKAQMYISIKQIYLHYDLVGLHMVACWFSSMIV